MTSLASRKAHVIGLGLIGCSVALALREVGWRVSGEDASPDIETQALDAGVIASTDLDPTTSLVVVATPSGQVVNTVKKLSMSDLSPSALITDVAGVKASIVADIDDPRFVGGHPMAGSEQRGLAGARSDLFNGATWVLTPTSATSPEQYSELHGYLREIGANVVSVDAHDHDRLVAIASHVPHLLAGSLMNEATEAAEQDAVLLQLAAGGFRDMTRIAAGDPSIWPDVLVDNKDAVLQSLESVVDRLGQLRSALLAEDRSALKETLQRASVARRQLPGRALQSEKLVYVRVRLSDQPGSLAAVTSTASDLLVNIYDIEIAHSAEEAEGMLLLAVDEAQSAQFVEVLTSKGFGVTVE